MSLNIPFKYDIGQIIAGLKGKDPRLWEALNNLNTATRDLNFLLGNTSALALYERITFHLPNDASGNDVQRYVIKMPVAPTNDMIVTKLNFTRLLLTSKVPSAGVEIDVQISNDRALTYKSMLKDSVTDPTVVYDKGTLPAGLTLMQYGLPQFSRATAFDNDFIRIDWVSGSPTEEIEVDLMGYYEFGIPNVNPNTGQSIGPVIPT